VASAPIVIGSRLKDLTTELLAESTSLKTVSLKPVSLETVSLETVSLETVSLETVSIAADATTSVGEFVRLGSSPRYVSAVRSCRQCKVVQRSDGQEASILGSAVTIGIRARRSTSGCRS
jgi:hypothetical protein